MYSINQLFPWIFSLCERFLFHCNSGAICFWMGNIWEFLHSLICFCTCYLYHRIFLHDFYGNSKTLKNCEELLPQYYLYNELNYQVETFSHTVVCNHCKWVKSFTKGDIMGCYGWFETTTDINMHVVPKKHFFKILWKFLGVRFWIFLRKIFGRIFHCYQYSFILLFSSLQLLPRKLS